MSVNTSLLKAVLLKPLTHGGVAHAPGEEIEVLAHDLEWLIKRGIAYAMGGWVKPSSNDSVSVPNEEQAVAAASPPEQPDTSANTTGD